MAIFSRGDVANLSFCRGGHPPLSFVPCPLSLVPCPLSRNGDSGGGLRLSNVRYDLQKIY